MLDFYNKHSLAIHYVILVLGTFNLCMNLMPTWLVIINVGAILYASFRIGADGKKND